MKRLVMIIAAVALYVLHQDFWFWRTAKPFILGFLPIGIAYHAGYTIAVSVLMWALVTYAWPGHLEEIAEDLTASSGEEVRRP